MKNLVILKKYGFKAAVAVMTSAPVLAMANTDVIGSMSTTITTEINKIIPVIASAGTALLSVYLLIKAFKMVSGFFTGRS